MKRLLIAVLGVTGLLAQATEITVDVAENVTTDLDTYLTSVGKTINKGDVLNKTGEGRLVLSKKRDLQFHTRINAGVVEVTAGGALGAKESNVRVKQGASLLINTTQDLGSNLHFRIGGTGHSSLGDAAGAISIAKANYQSLQYCEFLLEEGDATIFSGYPNADTGIFSRFYLDFSNGKELVLKGSQATSKGAGFRVRYSLDNYTHLRGGGTIVLDNAWLTHGGGGTFKNDGKDYPLILRNQALFGPGNQSLVDLFSSIQFEPGTGLGNNGTYCALTLPPMTGFPDASGFTITLNKPWTIRASDLASTSKLTTTKPLTLGSGLTVIVDPSGLTAGETRTIAETTDAAGITGDLPPLSFTTKGSANWKLEKSADGKKLNLVYDATKIPAGAVNALTWGLKTGAENAEANSAAIATGLAAVADGTTVFFPQGDYFFSEPIALSDKQVTLLGDTAGALPLATLRVDNAANVIAATNGKLTVSGFTLAGSTGPAVLASGVADFTVTACAFKAVGGAIEGVDGLYPVQATDSTNVFVKDNAQADATAYAGQVSVTGGSVSPATGDAILRVVLDVPAGESQAIADALTAAGFSAFPAGAKLVKAGGGTLVGATEYAFGELVVADGVYEARKDLELGPAKGTVRVENGATLYLSSTSGGLLAERHVYLSGAGYQNRGALDLSGDSWNYTAKPRFHLEADATINVKNVTLSATADSIKQLSLFNEAQLSLNDHTLRIVGGYPGNKTEIRFRLECIVKTGGVIEADNVNLTSSYKQGNGYKCESGTTTLRLVNSARLGLSTPEVLNIFDFVELAPSTTIWIAYDSGHDTTQKTIPFKGISGCMVAASGSTSFTCGTAYEKTTISKTLMAKGADIKAGKFFIAPTALDFGADAVVDISDLDQLSRSEVYTVARGKADTTISVKPKKGQTLKDAHWSLFVEGNQLKIKSTEGLMVILR